MKAQHIRPRVQNGRISREATRRGKTGAKPIARLDAKNAVKRAKSAAKSSGRASRREHSSTTTREHDSRVFWLMVLFGALLTAGFLLGLRSQINAHQLNRAEERLRDELDRYASQQKFLTLEQERALSPRESERSVKEAGLVQVKLDERYALAQWPVKPAKHTEFDPTKTTTSLPILAAKKDADKQTWVKPSVGKPSATRVGAPVKAPEKKTVKSKPVAGKQPNLASKAKSKATGQVTGNKQRSIETAKTLRAQSPKTKRSESGQRQVARTFERRSTSR